MNEKQLKKIQDLRSLIGNTPLLAIEFLYKGDPRVVYAKAEHYNMTGSIKDRMALHIMNKSYQEGLIKTGDMIVEATSGNTGIAFSAVGCALGHKVRIYMPDWLSQERINLIKSFGAEIQLVSKEEGGFLGSIQMTQDLAENDDAVFLPRQFSNSLNVEAHYTSTGPELWWQLKSVGLEPAAFIAGVGTGGTVMGIGKYLREQKADIKLYPLEPSNSPTLTTGYKVGKHRIQGVSDEFIPAIVDLDYLDEVIQVDDGDAIIMAQMLAARLGLGVGISSGANFLGALLAQEKLGRDKVAVTVFSDDNKKYLSTDLTKDEPRKEGFLSPDIELLGVRALNRVCYTCSSVNDISVSTVGMVFPNPEFSMCQACSELSARIAG